MSEKTKAKKYKLKGNESFNFREGWLRKGMSCIDSSPSVFTSDNAMVELGVGSKMVKSIRFWLQATDLSEEHAVHGGKRQQLFTEGFGQVIWEHDPYFEDVFTLFLLHYHIVRNDELCPAWNIFFNQFGGHDFTRKDMNEYCLESFKKLVPEKTKFSEKSFADDCGSILNMYLPPRGADDPEESLSCPLTELGLLHRSGTESGVYTKTAPDRWLLDRMAVLYVITANLDPEKNSASIDSLEKDPDNIGRVFNLGRTQINDYLDQLRSLGLLTINRTAGLDMIYIEHPMELSEIMERYYESQARGE